MEAIQWHRSQKMHFPLYHQLINANSPGYVSQNVQILKAIEIVLSNIPQGYGVWAFDRAHDRTVLYQEALLKKAMTWIVRIKMNQSFVPLQSIPIMGSKAITLKSLLPQVPLSSTPSYLFFPKQSGDLYMGWMRVYLPFDKQKLLSL